jgi:hypothetical protein
MSITVTIHFTEALTNVVITDVQSGVRFPLGNVPSGNNHDVEPSDQNGWATIHVAGKNVKAEPVQGRKRLNDGDIFEFPPAKSILDELAQFKDLAALVNHLKPGLAPAKQTQPAKPSAVKSPAVKSPPVKSPTTKPPS